MASKARSRGFLTVDAVGSREMVQSFKWLARDGIQQGIVGPTLEEAVDIVAGDARRNVAVDSGETRDSIRTKVSRWTARVMAGNEATLERWRGGQIDRSVLLEYGTPEMAARPFMRPALWGNKRRIEAILAKHMTATLARMGKGGSVFTTGGRGRFKRGRR